MMLSALFRRHGRVLIAGALLVAVLLVGAVVALGGSADVVVYNGRSQYGDEPAFTAWEEQTGKQLELRPGSAPELYERLKSEGADTPADLLVTTDLANLWRAKEAGLLEKVSTTALQRNVPEELRDPGEEWWGISQRIRTPMRSTERVGEGAVTSYADLGKPEFRGKLCLRTSNNEYNQSFVADQIGKRGMGRTQAMLERWMANDPQIYGSDVDVLEAIAAGRCDVGLTNHYYLGRILRDKADFPVTPAWPDQDGAGAHTNLSGVGLVKNAEHREDAIKLMEYLTSPPAQEVVASNSEFAANPAVPPAEHIRDWEGVKRDPIDVQRAGELLPQAVKLMQQVGWR
jgi:iron(III) transport system substrate-binding protein